MPLTLANTGDRINCGAGSSISTLDPYTVLWCQKFESVLTNVFTFVNKGTAGVGAGGTRRINIFNVNAAELRVALDRATTDTIYITNDTPLRTDLPMNVAVSFNSGNAAGDLIRVYSGVIDQPLKVSTFGTATDGSGAFGNDSTQSLLWGIGAGLGTPAFGQIYFGAICSVELSIDEINDFFINPIPVLRGIRGYWNFGKFGQVTVLDETGHGNHGTITGAVLAVNNLPLKNRFRIHSKRMNFPYIR